MLSVAPSLTHRQSAESSESHRERTTRGKAEEADDSTTSDGSEDCPAHSRQPSNVSIKLEEDSDDFEDSPAPSPQLSDASMKLEDEDGGAIDVAPVDAPQCPNEDTDSEDENGDEFVVPPRVSPQRSDASMNSE